MKNTKGFTIIGLLMVISIIGVSALIGLRFYSGDQQEKAKSTIIQEKAKNILVQANAETVQSLIQAELADRDINRDDVVHTAQNAGLYNPFDEVAMNSSKWFPESATVPGEIQITLLEGVFYIQGYGANGLLPDILTVQR
jgi:type II secretory pathway pseudopilin PulG